MALNIVAHTSQYFGDPDAGRPIAGGDVYVGIVDLDPTILANQKSVTLRQEDGTEVSVSQPISLSAGGYPTFNGSPVAILVDGDYSLAVLDSLGVQKFYAPSSTAGFVITSENSVAVFDSVADMKASSFEAGGTIRTRGYYSPGDKGEALYLIKTLADFGGTPDGFGDHSLANGNVAVLQYLGMPNARQFGATGDGTTDDTNSFAYAFKAASLAGGDVFAPKGVYRITQAVDVAALALSGVTGIGRLVGETYAYFTHFGASSDVPGSTDYSSLGTRCTVMKCDGCNLIGAVDTVGSVNANVIGTFKGLHNIFAWGTNSASIGAYYIPKDVSITNCTFVDFGWYGVATRNGITHKLDNVGFRNNGWDKAESGVFYTASGAQEDRYSYDSGCAIKIMANEVAQNYTKIEIAAWGSTATRRMTTSEFSNIYITASNPYLSGFSGIRGIQCSGIRSSTWNNVGSYFGNYFAVCSDDTFNSFHAEILSADGAVSGDGTPKSIVLRDCATVWNEAVRTVAIDDSNSGDSIVGDWVNYITDKGHTVSGSIECLVESDQAIKNGFGKRTLTAVTSGTNTVDFVGVIPTGFTGFVSVGAQYQANKVNNPVACFLIHNNAVATRVFRVASDPSTGGFSAEILSGAIVNTNDLRLTLQFGASWAGTEIFEVYIGITGTDLEP